MQINRHFLQFAYDASIAAVLIHAGRIMLADQSEAVPALCYSLAFAAGVLTLSLFVESSYGTESQARAPATLDEAQGFEVEITSAAQGHAFEGTGNAREQQLGSLLLHEEALSYGNGSAHDCGGMYR